MKLNSRRVLKHLKLLAYSSFGVILLLTSLNVRANNDNDIWAVIGYSAQSHIFYINIRTLKSVGMPPKLVSANIITRKDNKWIENYKYEFLCGKNEYKFSYHNFQKIPKGSVIQHLYESLCGFTENDKYLFIFGGSMMPDNPSQIKQYYYIDANSLIAIENPLNGISFKTYGAVQNLSSGGYLITNTYQESVIDCGNPREYYYRIEGVNNFSKGEIVQNSLISSAHYLVCSNYFKDINNVSYKNEASNLNNKVLNEDLILKAKKTCAELGFTIGTEKFGECVLRLSN